MDIKSLNSYIRFNSDLDLFDLLEPVFRFDNTVRLREITVESWHEMRIDLLFQSMYNLEPNEVGIYLENIDVILYINNIDNALNIKSGMNIRYPSLDEIDNFRYREDNLSRSRTSAKERLIVPNKTTRKDPTREKFKEEGYSLPPVVLDVPRSPVRIEGGQFSIGGL
jgi:hypothetical protein